MIEKNVPFTYDKACNGAVNPSLRQALFNFNVTRGLRDVVDGSSNTVAVSELIHGPTNTNDGRGTAWYDWGVQYTHLRPPNSPIPDMVYPTGYCVNTKPKAPCAPTGASWCQQAYAARSYHSGGVNSLFADGSTRFIKDSINLYIWQSIASINAGEVVSSDAY